MTMTKADSTVSITSPKPFDPRRFERRMSGRGSVNKFGAERTNGFASKRESDRHTELALLQRAGRIEGLRTQVRIKLETMAPDGARVPVEYESGRQASHLVDFAYIDISTGSEVFEEVKGVDHPLGKLKRAHVNAQLGIEIRVVR